MKNFSSIAESMLNKSQKTTTERVSNQMTSDIQVLCWMKGIKYEDVVLDVNEGIIDFLNVEDDASLRYIAERIAQEVEECGYLVDVIFSEDYLHIRSLHMRPFNESDFSRLTSINDVEFKNYGNLKVKFLPSAEDTLEMKVFGVFESGTCFEEFIGEVECDETASVTSSAYHYRVTDDEDDYVKIEF